MNLEDYQQAWQSAQSKVTINADLLLKEVQRSQKNFRTVILIRDFREVGVALLMLPLWFYLGYRLSMPWTWYLAVPAMVWVAAFLIVDRQLHSKNLSTSDMPVLKCVQDSLNQVEHQIWLLRNVFWWYLLPFAVPILTFFTHVAWLKSKSPLDAIAHATMFAFVIVLYYVIDRINQRAVRVDLEPRRQELLALRAGLVDESHDGTEPQIINNTLPVPNVTRHWLVIAAICAALLIWIALTR